MVLHHHHPPQHLKKQLIRLASKIDFHISFFTWTFHLKWLTGIYFFICLLHFLPLLLCKLVIFKILIFLTQQITWFLSHQGIFKIKYLCNHIQVFICLMRVKYFWPSGWVKVYIHCRSIWVRTQGVIRLTSCYITRHLVQ